MNNKYDEQDESDELRKREDEIAREKNVLMQENLEALSPRKLGVCFMKGRYTPSSFRLSPGPMTASP